MHTKWWHSRERGGEGTSHPWSGVKVFLKYIRRKASAPCRTAEKENELNIRHESTSLLVHFPTVEWSGHVN